MSINNKYEEDKIRSYLDLLQEVARCGNSLKESSDMTKKIDAAEGGSDKPAEKPAISTTDETEKAKSVKHRMDEYVTGISVDWGARVVKLKFKDGRVTSATCHPEDDFDLMVGISLCFARWVFGDLSMAIEGLLGF